MSDTTGALKPALVSASETFARALGLRVVDFGDREAVALDMLDDARFGDFGSGIDDASQHAVSGQVLAR